MADANRCNETCRKHADKNKWKRLSYWNDGTMTHGHKMMCVSVRTCVGKQGRMTLQSEKQEVHCCKDNRKGFKACSKNGLESKKKLSFEHHYQEWVTTFKLVNKLCLKTVEPHFFNNYDVLHIFLSTNKIVKNFRFKLKSDTFYCKYNKAIFIAMTLLYCYIT